MDDHKISVATTCLRGAEENAMTFPQIVGTLLQEGFESYAIDFRRARATFYTPDGDSVELATHRMDVPVGENLDAAAMRSAIKEAQQLVAGYTYRGFCRKAAAAGCAGYLVSLSGRRVLYVGRTAETHVEHFPN